MINGIGFFEIVLIVLIILVFFGSKELPQFVREAARFVAKIRKYSEAVKQEINDIARVATISPVASETFHDQVGTKKEALRTECLARRNAISVEERLEKSQKIAAFFLETDEFKKAIAIMMYAPTGSEVQTQECIEQILVRGKRVVVPYFFPQSNEMGIAEIAHYNEDCQASDTGMVEPKPSLHANFLKSDIQLVVCPGVGFDKRGGRLGRGKARYDTFLKELRDRIPLVGFAYQCQIIEEDLPFDYHDIPMSLIITEQGIQFRVKKEENG
ncbi:MAG: 5-formyltetrahydrofolate cyclo-ligase [Chitinivibrionales bacterium]|nr:5-formyltetrahydrofolate cyclo-ligase [Chitinivibrionales bacterium]